MRIHPISLCAGLLFAFLAACGDDAGAPPDGGGPATSVTQSVGPTGGTVALPGGGKLEIPAGALTNPVTIKVTALELGDVAALPTNLEPAGKPFAFEPFATVFAKPVKLTLPFTGTSVEVRPMKLDNRSDTTWQTIVGATKTPSLTLQFDTTTLGVYLGARPRAGSGVITLPDGAIVTPGNDSGVDAMVGMDAGSDAATDTDAMAASDAAVASDAATPSDAAAPSDAASDAPILLPLMITPDVASPIGCYTDTVMFTVSGGTPPYTWVATPSVSGDLTMTDATHAQWIDNGDNYCGSSGTVIVTVTDAVNDTAIATLSVQPG